MPDKLQVVFEDCQLEFETLSGLMRQSWAENTEQPLIYSADFLRSCFEYPGMRPDLAPVAMWKARPAGFVAGFPRTLSVCGQPGRFVLMTFFTVAPELKGKGVGTSLWAECLRKAQSAGFGGALHYCVDGSISNQATLAGARSAGFEAKRIFTVPYLARILKPLAEFEEPTEIPEAAHLFLVDAGRRIAADLPIARLWSSEEAEWQLKRRHDRCVAWNPNGGLLSGCYMRVADAEQTPCLFVDEIHWGELEAESRKALLGQFLRAASQQARLAVVPLLGYADTKPLQEAGFRRSMRKLHAYLTCWQGSAPTVVNALYADVS